MSSDLKTVQVSKCSEGAERGGGGLSSQTKRVEVCVPLPKAHFLFMCNMCDFTYPIYDLIRYFDILSVTVATDTVALNMIHESLLLVALSIMMKK